MKDTDGDHLWVSLTKDEIKTRFEKDKSPSSAEFETPEYNDRRTTVQKQYPDFATNIPTIQRQQQDQVLIQTHNNININKNKIW